MIYPQMPDNYAKVPNNNSGPIPIQTAFSNRNNPQIAAITIEDELYLERFRANYNRKELKKRHRTYKEVVFMDSYSYARRNKRPYDFNGIYCYCYDPDSDCSDNCFTIFYLVWILPFRCLFYSLYFLVRFLCMPILENCSFIGDCCCNILDRIRNGVKQFGLCIYELFAELFTYICMPCAYCCKDSCASLCGCLGNAFSSCWQTFSDFSIWNTLGNCCTTIFSSIWSFGDIVSNCLEWIFSHGFYMFFDLCNSFLDCLFSLLQQVGSISCEFLCELLCMCLK